jgi:hypothetical protein
MPITFKIPVASLGLVGYALSTGLPQDASIVVMR